MQITKRNIEEETALMEMLDKYSRQRAEMFTADPSAPDPEVDIKAQMDARAKDLGERVVARFPVRTMPRGCAAKRRKGHR